MHFLLCGLRNNFFVLMENGLGQPSMIAQEAAALSIRPHDSRRQDLVTKTRLEMLNSVLGNKIPQQKYNLATVATGRQTRPLILRREVGM